MLGKFSNALQSAFDTIAPPVPLLQDFIYHWKQVTKFYDSSDENLNQPIESTHLPIHMEQMLTFLQEEQDEAKRYKEDLEKHSGPCLEYLIEHKVPELLASLTVADTPSGMRHLGLVFFSRITSLAYRHLLTESALHGPVQKVVKMCGQTAASPTEAQEVRFLCVLAAVIGQKPDLGTLFSSAPSPSAPGSPSTSGTSSQESTPSPTHKTPKKENLIVEALLKFIGTADERLRVKVCESLLVLTPLSETATAISHESSLAENVSLRLALLHCEVPNTIEPGELEEMHASWGMDNPLEVKEPFLGCRQLAAYLSWWNFCDKLVEDSHQEIADAVVKNIQEHFLVQQLQTRICVAAELALNAAEDPKQVQDSIITLVHVGKLLRECRAPLLRAGVCNWLSGVTTQPFLCVSVKDSILKLLEVAHGDMAVEAMRLIEVIVEEPCEDALDALIFTHLPQCRIMARTSNETGESNTGKLETSLTLAPNNVQATLEGLLQLLPPFLRTGETEAGYESYLQDAQRQYQAMWGRCAALSWPLEVECDAETADEDEASSPLLQTLFSRIEQFPEQEYELNLQLTSLLSRLALLPHAGLHELLLSPERVSPSNQKPEQLTVGTGLAVSLRRLALRLAKEAPSVPSLQKRLRSTRNRLLGDPSLCEDAPPTVELTNEQESLLESIVVLEEFCKELSAITFVKYHLHCPT